MAHLLSTAQVGSALMLHCTLGTPSGSMWVADDVVLSYICSVSLMNGTDEQVGVLHLRVEVLLDRRTKIDHQTVYRLPWGMHLEAMSACMSEQLCEPFISHVARYHWDCHY